MKPSSRIVALTTSFVLATSVFIPSQAMPAAADAAGMTAIVPAKSNQASVTASTAGKKPVGQLTNTWGTTTNVPAGTKIVTQVRLANGNWSTSQHSTVGKDGRFVIELTYGKHQPGTYQWRVVAYPKGKSAVVSNTFTLTRTTSRTITAATAGTKRVGEHTNGWGRVTGIPVGAHVESQVRLPNGNWSRSQVSKIQSGGKYVIPLTYGKHQAGTYRWRFVARHGGVATVSPERTLKRVGNTAVASNASITAHTAGTKRVGELSNTWGSTSGIAPGTRIETQVRLSNGKWSRSQVSTVKSNGSFVIPLTYGANAVGKYRYRVVVHGSGFSVVSNEFVLTRVAQPAPAKPKQSSPSPGLGTFPNASNTGVPTGTSLRNSGSIEVTRAGTVIDGLNVRGSIDIKANNVTVRNSRIATTNRYPIRVHSGVTGALIERVEIDGMGSPGKGIYFSGGSGTIRYSNIHSSEDGVFITADNVNVEHNYIHNQVRNSGAHPDGIQIRGGDDVTIRGNTIIALHPRTGVSNAAIQIGSLVGDTIDNFRVVDNYMTGGRFTINGGGRGEVASATYSGNRFGRDHQYGVAGNIENSVWASSNVYHDNGKPAR